MEDTGSHRKRGRKTFALRRKSSRDVSSAQSAEAETDEVSRKLDQATSDMPSEQESGSAKGNDQEYEPHEDPTAQQLTAGPEESQSDGVEKSPVEARARAIEDVVASPAKPSVEGLKDRQPLREELLEDRVEAMEGVLERLLPVLSELPARLRQSLDESQRTNDLISSALAEQSQEINSLARTVRGSRSAWDKMQEDLSAMRGLVAERDRALLDMVDSRMAEMQRRGIEAIDQAQVKLGGVAAELPKALAMEGSEYSEQIKSLIPLLSAQRDREKAIMATIQGARSAFIRVQEELQSVRALISAREQAVLGLLDSQLEKMQSHLVDARLDEIRRAQGQLAEDVRQLPATIALDLQKTEFSEQIKALLESSLSDESRGTVLKEMVQGTMSALRRTQELLKEMRELASTRDEALLSLVDSRLEKTPIDQINARIQAIHDWQRKLAGGISELPAAIGRNLEETLQTDKIVALLGSAVGEKSQERTYLLNTVEGARSAFQRVQESMAEMRDLLASQVKVQEAVDGMRDLLAKRDQAVVQLLDSRLEELQKGHLDSRLEALEDAEGRLAQAISELTTTFRRDIEVAAVVLGDRVGEEATEILKSVRSLQRALTAQLADAPRQTTDSITHDLEMRSERTEGGARRRGGAVNFEWRPFGVLEGEEEDSSGYIPPSRALPSAPLSTEERPKFAVTKPPGAALGRGPGRSEPKPSSRVGGRRKLPHSEEVASKGGRPKSRRRSGA